MLTRRYHRLRSVDCHCTGIQVIRYLMPLIKKANRTRRKCIHHFKLAAGWLAAWRSRIQAAAAAARTHGEGGGRSRARRWNQQESGRHRGRKVKAGREGEGYVKAFHSLARLPRVAPANPSLCLDPPSTSPTSPHPRQRAAHCAEPSAS